MSSRRSGRRRSDGRQNSPLRTDDVAAVKGHGSGGGATACRASNYLLVLLCFFLSGLAALLYQTAWMRQFAVVFGTSELAVATVLAAYMGGLAAGAAVAGRLAERLRRPVFVYGVLELTIAVGALLVPLWLTAARALQEAAIGGQPELPDAGGVAQPLFYVTSAFVALMIPTGCMGATLPLLASYAIHSDDQIGTRVGTLYAVNTLGAVAGALMAAFLLLPQMGLFHTTLWGAGANVCVFVAAALLARRTPSDRVAPESCAVTAPAEPAAPLNSSFDGLWLTLPIMFVSGLVSFTYEVLWTRLLGHVVGGSTYAFATMLSTFLIGITVGAALASRFARGRVSGWLGLTVSQMGIAAASIAVYSSIEQVPGLAASWNAGAGASLAANVGLCALFLLPVTLCIGATFPFAVRLMAADENAAAADSGRIYAWNTAGGVAGALLAGFWIVPELGFAGTVRFAVTVSLGLALATALLHRRFRLQAGSAVAAACVIILVLFNPKTPHAILRMSPVQEAIEEGEVVYQGIGRSSTVRLTDGNGYFSLQNNGLPEAVIGMKGSPPFGGAMQSWLTALPIIARPQARSLLVIGFGSGQVVDTIPETVRRIDVIELEPEVIEANRRIAQLRERDPLDDPRLRIILNDARGALNLSSRRYDIIVSQPSHPWTAGASHLYTQQFMQLVHEHLDQGGTFLQWLNSDLIDEDLFRSMAATLLSVFKHVRLYQPISTALLFVASDEPLQLEANVASGQIYHLQPNCFDRLPVNGVNDLAAICVLDTAGLRAVAAGAPVNTDDHNRLAFHSSALKSRDDGTYLDKLTRSQDVLFNRDSELLADPDVAAALNPSLIARRMCVQRQWERAAAYAQSFREPGMRELLAGVISHASGELNQAREWLRRSLRLNSSLNEARFLLCELSLAELAQGRAPRDVLTQLELLNDPERAVVEANIAMERSDFETMEELEPRLQTAKPSQLCYVDSLYCRAAWRSAPRPHPQRARLAREAIDLVDHAMSIRRRSYGYMMRMNAAVLANRPVDALETVRQYARQLSIDAASQAGRTQASKHLPVMTRLLVHLEHDPRVDAAVWEQVSAFVSATVQDVTPANRSLLTPNNLLLPTGYQTSK